MVSKRQGSNLSDSDFDNSPPKRARRDVQVELSDAEDSTPPPPAHVPLSNNAEGITQISDDSDIEIEADETGQNLADLDDAENLEDQVRMQHIEKIRSEFQQGVKKSGVRRQILELIITRFTFPQKAASMGIIQKVDLTNVRFFQ